MPNSSLSAHVPMNIRKTMVVGGIRTSIRLEQDFWEHLEEIADSRSIRLSGLIDGIAEATPERASLASTLRTFTLRHALKRASGTADARHSERKEGIMEIDSELYPVAVIQDRYSGTYSGGFWLAVANADIDRRVMAVLENGPHGDDGDAMIFWNRPPFWIASGATPTDAIEKLHAQCNARDPDACPNCRDPRFAKAAERTYVETERVRIDGRTVSRDNRLGWLLCVNCGHTEAHDELADAGDF